MKDLEKLLEYYHNKEIKGGKLPHHREVEYYLKELILARRELNYLQMQVNFLKQALDCNAHNNELKEKALTLACKELSYRDSPPECKRISVPRTFRYKMLYMKKARTELGE